MSKTKEKPIHKSLVTNSPSLKIRFDTPQLCCGECHYSHPTLHKGRVYLMHDDNEKTVYLDELHKALEAITKNGVVIPDVVETEVSPDFFVDKKVGSLLDNPEFSLTYTNLHDQGEKARAAHEDAAKQLQYLREQRELTEQQRLQQELLHEQRNEAVHEGYANAMAKKEMVVYEIGKEKEVKRATADEAAKAVEVIRQRIGYVGAHMIQLKYPDSLRIDEPFDDYLGVNTRMAVERDESTGAINLYPGKSIPARRNRWDSDFGAYNQATPSEDYFASILPIVTQGKDIKAVDVNTNKKVKIPVAAGVQIQEHKFDGTTETYYIYFPSEKDVTKNPGVVMYCPQTGKKTFIDYAKMADSSFLWPSTVRKPVIYLYPEEKRDVTVTVDFKGKFSNTYPSIEKDTWQVSAYPDGTLEKAGKKYKYLFWDGIPSEEPSWDFSQGFCVKRDDVDGFLEEKTAALGLNFAEAQDFITYWAPVLKQNEYSLVSFQTAVYEDLAKLTVQPNPDTLIRVFMVFKSISGSQNIQPQALTSVERKGFTVVEWGGSNVDESGFKLR